MSRPKIAISTSNNTTSVREMTDEEYTEYCEKDMILKAKQREMEINEVRVARHAAYSAPDGPDAIYMKYLRGEATEQEWLDSIDKVKEENPYPSFGLEDI